MNTSRELSISRNEFGEGSVGNVTVRLFSRFGDTSLIFTLETTTSGSKSKESLREKLEQEWSAFLSDIEGTNLGQTESNSSSSSSETIGSPKNTKRNTPIGVKSSD